MYKKTVKKISRTDSPVSSRKPGVKTMNKPAVKKTGHKPVKTGEKHPLLPAADQHKLISELELRQIELEIQNKELLRIKDELEKSREWYADLYDLSPIGYFTFNETGTILEANLTAASFLDQKRNSLNKQPFSRFLEPEDQEIFYLRQQNLFKTGKKQTFELRIKKKDRSLCWVRMETILAYGKDSMLTSRAAMSDISERKIMEEEKRRIEEQIINNQRLESLGTLAGGIAHNFNNLLSGIFGYIELADRKAANPEVSKYLSEALGMRERAKRLTGQLLTFSKGGAPVKKNGYLFPLVKDSVHFSLNGTKIACRFDVDDDLYPCNFDANQICQVIDNIILNARQAMPDGGIIDVTAKNIHLDENNPVLLPEGRYIKISIKDSGVGMTHKILSNIFNPFFSTKISGHGLGLATSYSIIKRHGGSITADSKPGKGCTVNIFLPEAEYNAVPVEEIHDSAHTGNGTIIIMDDEECIRNSLSEILMSMGYDVIHMEDGNEVVKYLKESDNTGDSISGVILDLVVPGGMGGKTAITEIRKIGQDIPVFAISGYADDPVIENPAEYGFTASIGKPFLITELSELLNRYLKKNL